MPSPKPRRFHATLVACSLIVSGCLSAPGPSVPHPYDFFGDISEYDLSEWEASGAADTVGGPTSEQLVGPGRFVLGDGTEVRVRRSTPGGSLCTLLASHPVSPADDHCVIIGEWGDGTADAAWFGILEADVLGEVAVVSNLTRLAVGTGALAAFDEEFEFRLADLVQLQCLDTPSRPVPKDGLTLPPAAAYYAVIDLVSHEIVAIECGYSS